jgi:hypothetical protein
MMSNTPLGDTEEQQDYRDRGERDYRPRHGEPQLAEQRGLALDPIGSAAAGSGNDEVAQPRQARGRHQGARARWPRLRRRGSHGTAM